MVQHARISRLHVNNTQVSQQDVLKLLLQNVIYITPIVLQFPLWPKITGATGMITYEICQSYNSGCSVSRAKNDCVQEQALSSGYSNAMASCYKSTAGLCIAGQSADTSCVVASTCEAVFLGTGNYSDANCNAFKTGCTVNRRACTARTCANATSTISETRQGCVDIPVTCETMTQKQCNLNKNGDPFYCTGTACITMSFDNAPDSIATADDCNTCLSGCTLDSVKCKTNICKDFASRCSTQIRHLYMNNNWNKFCDQKYIFTSFTSSGFVTSSTGQQCEWIPAMLNAQNVVTSPAYCTIKRLVVLPLQLKQAKQLVLVISQIALQRMEVKVLLNPHAQLLLLMSLVQLPQMVQFVLRIVHKINAEIKIATVEHKLILIYNKRNSQLILLSLQQKRTENIKLNSEQIYCYVFFNFLQCQLILLFLVNQKKCNYIN